MATPRDIKRRIISVKNTQKITKAMQMVASVKLRKARDRVVNARPYFEKLTQIGAAPVRGPSSNQFSLFCGTAKRKTCALWLSDRTRPVRCIQRQCGEEDDGPGSRKQGKNVDAHHLGKKPIEAFKRKPVTIADRYLDMMFSPKYSSAETVGQKLLGEFAAGSIDEVIAVYNEFKSPASQRVTAEKLLPACAGRASKAPGPPTFLSPRPRKPSMFSCAISGGAAYGKYSLIQRGAAGREA